MEIEPYQRNSLLPPVYIVDIDGTLSHVTRRNRFDETKVIQDRPNFDVLRVISEVQSDVILMTGRTEKCREDTEMWMGYYDVHYLDLIMRPVDDMCNGSEMKYKLFNRHIRNEYNVVGVFEDKPAITQMWRSLGLTVFQVVGE